MELLHTEQDDIQIIRIEGKIDSESVRSIEESLFNVIEQGFKKLAVDFKRIEFISSSGIRSLLMLVRKIDEYKGLLVVYNLKSQIREIFEISGIDNLIKICDTKKDSLEYLGSIDL